MARFVWRLIRLPWVVGRTFFGQRRLRRRREERSRASRRGEGGRR